MPPIIGAAIRRMTSDPVPVVHGARSVLSRARTVKHPDRLRSWVLRLEKTAGHNKATVALANKIARIAFSVWKHDRDFSPVPETQAA